MTIRWTAVTIPEKSGIEKLQKELIKKPIETIPSAPDKANAALYRIEIPQDAIERIVANL